ncbi:MAG: sulfate ABC transporter substrate-binding protein [Rhodococcus sp.]|nr:sulfate ABC transporter substrate-binding protein [Rhodococcus sp. (in: high G+C Gram-positive bacteria)]
MKHRPGIVLAAIAVVGALTMSACAGGSSDVPGGRDTADGSAGTLNLYAYAVPKPGFDKIIPAFNSTDEGDGVAINPSFGASGDQSRKVAAGAPTDIVNFSLTPDVTRLVDAGLVDPDWDQDAYQGIPYGSVVTIVVREGNPLGIEDWDDLLQPGLEVITPNPFSSGSAKWNLLAPYAAKSNGGQNPQAGLDYVSTLINEHVRLQPKSGREATEAFLQGAGDVLLSYENEALFIQSHGEPVEHVTPAQTFRVDNPVAVLSTSQNPEKANAFRDFLYSKPGQRIWAEAGFGPVDPAVAAEFEYKFPAPEKLWTIDDLGGWSTVDPELFAQGTGSIAVIYDAAN